MQKHKIITCASFGNTGSGVVTDYLLEFDNILNPGDYEFRFLHDYDGVSTLEHSLIHNFHRMNSDIAIQNFKRYIEFQSGDFTSKRYEKYFNGKFKEESYRYIENLIDVKWKGYWEQYQIISPKYVTFFKYKLLPRVLRFFDFKSSYIAKYVPKSRMYFAAPSEAEFLKYTNDYLSNLCNAIDQNNEYSQIFFDQFVPPLNLQTYLRYYPNMKIVVVDRDPRDHYIDNLTKWHEGWIPTDLDSYIQYYKKLRINLINEQSDDRVLRLNFEDAIYNYDSFSKQLNDFLELNEINHIRKMEFFNPEKSKNNTQLWVNNDKFREVANVLEFMLPEYCYKFND